MEKSQEKERKIAIQIYIVFTVSVLLNFAPSAIIPSFGALLFLITLVAIYVYRSKSIENGLLNTHMSYMIKSFWVSSLILSIGLFFALMFGNHEIIHNFIEATRNGQIPTQSAVESAMVDYAKTNIVLFLMTLLPGSLYLLYRIVKGLIWAKNNQTVTVTNLKSWI